VTPHGQATALRDEMLTTQRPFSTLELGTVFTEVSGKPQPLPMIRDGYPVPYSYFDFVDASGKRCRLTITELPSLATNWHSWKEH